MEIVCPHCAAVNRVPSDKPAEKAKCGACKNALFSGKPANATTQSFATHIRRNDIPMAKAASLKIKLLSTADTGYFYVT